MRSHLIDNLIGQIEIFDALELQAAGDYADIVRDLNNEKFRDIIDHIRIDELYHSKMCREIIDFLNQRPTAAD